MRMQTGSADADRSKAVSYLPVDLVGEWSGAGGVDDVLRMVVDADRVFA